MSARRRPAVMRESWRKGSHSERFRQGSHERLGDWRHKPRNPVQPQETPPSGQQVDDKAADTPNPNATSTGPVEPAGPCDSLSHGVICGVTVDALSWGLCDFSETSTDETAATTTANVSMGANARTSYSASLAGERDGQATTDDAGADNSEDETTSIPDAPQSMPLGGECTGRRKTGANARSTSHDRHQPDESDESRPSEDPADTTGDDERHPDESTELPDKPEGARWRSGELRAGTVESKIPGEPRCAEAMGEISDETCQPSKPTEPPDEVEDAYMQTDEPCDESKDRAGIQSSRVERRSRGRRV
ncbi:hypothetical protein J3R82DRAFT_8264 [Butyriboletus roseoflavus]|nr:hypothetical protein J3R82DRAFT_8264 [Butyriboletus roseoflavus]